jgi:hypothetical protein
MSLGRPWAVGVGEPACGVQYLFVLMLVLPFAAATIQPCMGFRSLALPLRNQAGIALSRPRRMGRENEGEKGRHAWRLWEYL